MSLNSTYIFNTHTHINTVYTSMYSQADTLNMANQVIITVAVPHSKSGLVPRSSLSGAGQLGFWEIGKGGTIG